MCLISLYPPCTKPAWSSKNNLNVLWSPGVPPGGLSRWDAHVRSFESNIHGAVKQAYMGTGAAYLLKSLGLFPFGEDTKACPHDLARSNGLRRRSSGLWLASDAP